MFTKILIPLDGSALSEQALLPGAALARATGATVILMRVPVVEEYAIAAQLGGVGLFHPAQQVDRAGQDAAKYLVGQSEALTARGIDVTTQAVDGQPAAAIVDVAKREGVDLIVMSTHGRSGVSRWMMGSVAERVVRYGKISTYLVRSDKLPTHIVVPLDGSAFAELALTPARQVASAFDADVSFVHVDEYGEIYFRDSGLSALVRRSQVRDPAAYLRTIRQDFNEAGIRCGASVLHGKASPCIIEHAADEGADLVVMSSHGYSAFERWLIGSTTVKVMHGFHGSILVIRGDA